MMTGFGMGFGWMGFLAMAIFWVAVIAAAIWLLGILFPKNNPTAVAGNTSDTAVDILKKRYARGEINKEDFEAMRHDLEP